MKKLSLDELNRPTVEEFKLTSKIPVVVVLDNVRSAMNVGSFFRTCDAFNIEKLYLVGITATPPNREITKSAIGATESVDWEYAENMPNLLQELKSKDYGVIAVEQTDQSTNLKHQHFSNQMKYALIFGNEVEGVSDKALEFCDMAIEIPQLGTKHSLNVSVCGGVVIWEFFKVFS
jgi:tRNA G18 (ribose-2'-O)-methylase SpoU